MKRNVLDNERIIKHYVKIKIPSFCLTETPNDVMGESNRLSNYISLLFTFLQDSQCSEVNFMPGLTSCIMSGEENWTVYRTKIVMFSSIKYSFTFETCCGNNITKLTL